MRCADNPNVSIKLRDHFPFLYTTADGQAWIDRCSAMKPPQTQFAVATATEAIGESDWSNRRSRGGRSLAIGWMSHSGRGIMALAAKAMVEYVFYRLGVDRIESSTFGWNAASRRVLESAGFAYEGRLVDAVVKDGRATDQLLFGLDRDAR